MYYYSEAGVFKMSTTVTNGVINDNCPCDEDGGGGGTEDCFDTVKWLCDWRNSFHDSRGDCTCQSDKPPGCGGTYVIVKPPGCNGEMSINPNINSTSNTCPCGPDESDDTGGSSGGGTGGGSGTPSNNCSGVAPCGEFEQYDESCNCVTGSPLNIIPINNSIKKKSCKRLNELETDNDFKIVLQELKDSASEDNHETGYFLTINDDQTYNYSDELIGSANDLGINTSLNQDEQIAGFIHNHNHDDQNRDLSVYSPEDLFVVYNWLKNGHVQTPSQFFSFLVTNHGTAYALNISDSQAFIAFGDIVFNGWGDGNKTNNEEALVQEYRGNNSSMQTYPLGIKNSNTVEQNELSFMKILSFSGINVGLELFKADDNFENWKKVDINNEQINYNDICN